MFADDAESLKKSKASKSSFIHGFINLLYFLKILIQPFLNANIFVELYVLNLIIALYSLKIPIREVLLCTFNSEETNFNKISQLRSGVTRIQY